MALIGVRRALIRPKKPVVVALDPATTAWVNAVVGAGGTVSGTQQGFVDTLIKALKGHSLFSIQDRIWLHASENSQQATIDIVNLGVATLVAAPTFAANQGFAGNGTSSYLNSGYNSGTNFLQNSASISTYVRTSRTTNGGAAIGRLDTVTTGNQGLILPLATGVMSYDVNNTQFSNQPANTNAQGFWTASRTGVGAIALYRNSSSTAFASAATASNALPTGFNFFIGARNGSGTADNFSSDQIAITTMGGGMTNVQAAQFQTDLNAYMTSLTTNVY